MEIENIQISEIFRDENQPRKYFDEDALSRLVQSIKDNGVENPITVRKNGNGFVIIDGERRWRASKEAGLAELPCVITDKEDILEQQLRSDCLKEGLTVDELDRAIYKYYEMLLSSEPPSKYARKNTNAYLEKIMVNIGKSENRVRKAIDRFEFKRDNKDFTEEINKKHNPENKRFSKVDSTIAMTDKLKDKPEVRKAVVAAILDNRKKEKFGLDNDSTKKKIDVIVRKSENENFKPEDVQTVFEDIRQREEPIKMLKNDPRYLFQSQYFEFNKFTDSFYDFEFDTVKEHLQKSDLIKKFKNEVEGLLNYIKQLED